MENTGITATFGVTALNAEVLRFSMKEELKEINMQIHVLAAMTDTLQLPLGSYVRTTQQDVKDLVCMNNFRR